MIEVKTNNGQTSVSVNGSLMTLTTDTAMMLRGIWRSISEKSADGGKLFAATIKDIINNPQVSPFSDSDMSDAPDVAITRIDFDELMRQMQEE